MPPLKDSDVTWDSGGGAGGGGGTGGIVWDNEPHPDAVKEAKKNPGGFFSNLLVGLESAPSDFADIATTMVDRVMGLPVDSKAYQTVKRGAAESVSEKIGSVTGVKPSKVGENSYLDKFARNLGEAAPFFGGVRGVRGAITALGAVGGQTAAEEAAPNSPALQTIGALAGGLATHGVTKLPSMARRMFSDIPTEDRAAQHVTGVAANAGRTPADIRQFGEDAGDKPVIGAEALGRQGITQTRALGLRPGTTGDKLEGLLDERTGGTGERVLSDAEQATGVDPHAVLGDIEEVVKQGHKAAKPLYDVADEGHSVAPLEKAFEQENTRLGRVAKEADQAVADAETKMTLAHAKLDMAGDNVYAQNSARAAVKKAEKGLEQAQQAQTEAGAAKDETLERLRQAQSDRENGVKGGMWSPYLQRLLQNKNIKKGLARGFSIENDKADARNEPFNPRDLAITGTDAEGMPIVKGVPTMRVLDMGKRGLDALIQEHVDPTTKRLNTRDPQVKALLELKDSYVQELDRLNPDYGKARAVAGDYLGVETAFHDAKKMFGNPKVTNAQFQRYLGKLGETERRAAKGGAVRYLFDQAEAGKLTGKMFNKPILRKKLEGLVDDPDKTATFLMRMNLESSMAKSGARMHPGMNSTTFESAEAASTMDRLGSTMSALKAGHSLITGHPFRAAKEAYMAAQKAGAFARAPGMGVETRNAVGDMMMLPPKDLAHVLERYSASQNAAKLARPKLQKGGLLPALAPQMQQMTQSQLPGDNQ